MDSGSVGGLMLLVGLAVLGIVIYLIPSIVATRRGHPNATPIIVLNLLLGWTVLGWVGALVWSLTALEE